MGIEFGFNSLWDHNYISNTVETTTEVVRQLYHEPEIVLEVAEHAYDEFVDASGPERARMLSSLASNIAVGIATPTFGCMTKLGIFAKLHKVDLNISGKVATKSNLVGLSNLELVQKAANKAEKSIGGVGRFAGTEKHNFARDLLERYQEIYGHRGLFMRETFNNGPGNIGRLDVLDRTNGIIYDWKFGYPGLTPAQLNLSPQMMKYQRNYSLPTQIIKPNGD